MSTNAFILILHFCSIEASDCLPAFQHKQYFDDYYSCVVQGHTDALEMLVKLGIEETNNGKIVFGHECIETKSKEL